jgi:Cu+-exporting ATPase
LYSGIDYLKSAYKGIKLRDFNIDLPIALGMLALFSRSLYEIIGQHGEGYLDSFAGFVFFLFIGRWFQAFTYRSFDFDRNYKSYFPISANVFVDNEWSASR